MRASTRGHGVCMKRAWSWHGEQASTILSCCAWRGWPGWRSRKEGWSVREDMGWPLPPAKRAEHDRTVTAIRRVLGERAFEEAWAKGHALPSEEAIEHMLTAGSI